MNPPFEILLPRDELPRRRVLFAIQLVDAVTLATVSQGVKVTAEGLNGKPIVNASGLFVWLQEEIGRLRKVTIRPGTLPYEDVERGAEQLTLPPNPRPLTIIELPPRVDYAFSPGVTGLRGTLIEERANPPTPVGNVEVRLRWLDENGAWHDAPTKSQTNKQGDLVSLLRLAPTDEPGLDANGAVTVRLKVIRDGGSERTSAAFKLPQGRVTDRSILPSLLFAWDELQP